MLKRIFLMMALLLPVLAQAQYGVGDWRVHPYYIASQFNNVIDTGDQIYYLVGDYLFRFDKATDENEALTKRTILNDASITGIYYNYAKRYLVVTYLNSNIDIIDANGNVTNLPEIKDAIITGNKGINFVSFSDNLMLVATEFGFVTYDDNKMVVAESRIFDTDIKAAFEVGQWRVIAHTDANNDIRLYTAKKSAMNETIGNYIQNSSTLTAVNSIQPINETQFLICTNSSLSLAKIGNSGFVSFTPLVNKKISALQPTKNGYLASSLANDTCYIVDPAATAATFKASGHELFTANPRGDGTLWALGEKGLHRNGDDTNYYRPDGIGLRHQPYWMAYFSQENRLLFCNTSYTALFSKAGKDAHSQIYSYDGNRWTDVTPENLATAVPDKGESANWEIVPDPFDPHTYVYSSRKSGIVKVTNDKVVYVYGTANSPTVNYRGCPRFDSQGNLWVVYGGPTASGAAVKNVFVLPRAKYEAATCTKSDWYTPSVPGTKQSAFNGATMAIGRADAMVFNSGNYRKEFAFWQPNGSLGNVLTANYGNFMDQDEKSVTWDNVYAMVADKNGIVWAGLDNGIISFDPSQAFSDNFRINHIKVPRNDGTDLADYLLDGIQVNCIAVDGANRKWIGTNESGLFLVSPDGSKILKQFTSENSYLTTNTIYNVCCNPNSNSVYIYTSTAFLEYFSDTTPGANDYSDVYVYPNPVRPEFTGLVTINGLMDNSLVKIADASGNVVKQLRSSGGMATWDCCGDNGERVKTGVYYVLASQKESGSASAAVAKFLVVK